MTQAERINWIDIAKAVGIYLVVLGHLDITPVMRNVIYSFHMPLFFFISGFTFKRALQLDFATLLKKKFQSLVCPYISFSIILFLFLHFVRRRLSSDPGADFSASDALIQIALGVNGEAYSTPLWFLVTLFLAELALWSILKINKKPWQMLVVLAMFSFGMVYEYLYQTKGVKVLPFDLNLVAYYEIFLVAGYYVSELSFWKNMQLKNKLLGLFLSMVLFALSLMLNSQIAEASVGIWVSVAAAFLGIATTLFISQLIPRNKVLDFVGKNTLVILALHLIAFSVLKAVCIFVLHLDISVLQNAGFANVVYAIATIVILTPVIMFINRFTPWLVRPKLSIKN